MKSLGSVDGPFSYEQPGVGGSTPARRWDQVGASALCPPNPARRPRPKRSSSYRDRGTGSGKGRDVTPIGAVGWQERSRQCVPVARALGWLASTVLVAILLCGCAAPKATPVTEADAARETDTNLREGDVIKVTFPGTPTLNTTQQVRRDGNISLPLAGDVKAAGLAPDTLEKEILAAYGDQLLSQEVTVSLESAAIPVYVTGMVMRPGKVMLDRPTTVLEAIMECGGFEYSRANLKRVRVMRREDDRMRTFIINLRPTLEGDADAPFYVRPADMVYVPERFTLF